MYAFYMGRGWGEEIFSCLFCPLEYNGQMFDGQKDIQQNLTDTGKDTKHPTLLPPLAKGRAGERSEAYPKLNKLITALYIVTDIMDKEEPIRLKLRTLGVEILSDLPTGQAGINSISNEDLNQKIQTILSFLDISLSINLISEMNCNILRKEFIELSQLFQLSTKEPYPANPMWLKEFLAESPLLSPHPSPLLNKNKERGNSTPNILKKQRRNDIIRIIKENGGSATVSDIKNKASLVPASEENLPVGQAGSLATCGEKTIQRELVSMVKDDILSKTGEKRWSRYFIK